MSLQIFFKPQSSQEFASGTLGESVKIGTVPADCRAALISIGYDTEHVRQMLFGLSALTQPYTLSDLGELRLSSDQNDTCERLAQVCATLMRSNVLPIVLADDQAYTLGQFWAYRELNKTASLLCIDSRLDIEQNYLESILLEPTLFRYAHLGYQRYLVANTQLQNLLKLNYELKSVGQMRDDFCDNEATIRDADIISFDLGALKSEGVPFGLTGEEACQLCWYAGVSPMLSAFGLYGNASAPVVATMLWYLLEGLSSMSAGRNLSANHCRRFLVTHTHSAREIVFFHNELTGQWWMEVPGKNQGGRLPIVACSEADYQAALEGQLPERWLRGMEMFLG